MTVHGLRCQPSRDSCGDNEVRLSQLLAEEQRFEKGNNKRNARVGLQSDADRRDLDRDEKCESVRG